MFLERISPPIDQIPICSGFFRYFSRMSSQHIRGTVQSDELHASLVTLTKQVLNWHCTHLPSLASSQGHTQHLGCGLSFMTYIVKFYF